MLRAARLKADAETQRQAPQSGVAAAGASGALEADRRSRFREDVTREKRYKASQRCKQGVAVGVILPKTVELNDIPPEFGMRGYRYTIFNDRTVLLDPRTRVVVDVVD